VQTSTIVGAMDITCCAIPKPVKDKNCFWCYKCKNYVLKYSIVINYLTGKIVDVFGGTPGGIPDFSIGKKYLIPKLGESEYVTTDKIFSGHGKNFVIPHFEIGRASCRERV